MVPTATLLRLWAKKDKAGRSHPLVCHLLDVSAVALALWDRVLTESIRAWFAAGLGLEHEAARRWLAFVAGVHDLGKCSPGFQRQSEQAKAALAGAGFVFREPVREAAHGVVTAAALVPELRRRFPGLDREDAEQVSVAAGGHHGVFPSAAERNKLPERASGRGLWESSRSELIRRVAAVVELRGEAPRRVENGVALPLAGFISVCDWIASDSRYFPFVCDGIADGFGLEEYWEQTREGAARALEALGWLHQPQPCGAPSFRELFPDFEPRPLQEAVCDLGSRLEGPALVIAEAPMGEGKTEAALCLMRQWQARLAQRGAYFALPTQATSNQLFSRVREFLARVDAGSTVDLQLLHGHASLSAGFAEVRTNAAALLQPENVCGEGDSGGVASAVVAAEWFTYRKRGLLGPYGVGTVDQVLLGALQTRHVFVRLFGLAGKTVVIDEVHAYDTYMTALLERLLEWLAAVAAPVVMLSATLPSARRRRLLEAYGRGLGARCEAAASVAYPRLSWVSRSGEGARRIDTSAASARTVALEFVENGEEGWAVGDLLEAELAEGGCGAVICNTVGRAQRVYRALEERLAGLASDGEPRLDLLHSRFPFDERQAREERSVRRFGKVGPRPDRAVLVATQIVEQSLDLDFDLLVTDLAPVDLVLQRAGRLHRHERTRPRGLSQPRLVIRMPGTDASGAPQFDPGWRAVYDPHVLLRSWLALRDRKAVAVPADIEALIETVYGEGACPEGLPPAVAGLWSETLEKLCRERAQEEQEAQARWLKSPNDGGPLWRYTANWREEDAPDLHMAFQALTRLTERSVTVVCLYGSRERSSLDRGGREVVDLSREPPVGMTRALLGRSVPVTDKRVVFKLLEEPTPASWRRSPLLRHCRLLLFDAAGHATVGGYRVVLSPELGVMVEGGR
jgi:CRISPR-associated endonuclease/helicase Cas3